MLENLTVDSILEEIVPILEGKVKPKKDPSYFARAIRGGRGNLENSIKIVEEMEKYSTVLSKHVILKNYQDFEREWKNRFPNINVHQRDMKMIGISKRFIADLTVQSTGVEYEFGEATLIRKIPSAFFCHEMVKNEKLYVYRIDRRPPKEITRGDFLNWLRFQSDPVTPLYYYNDQNVEEVAEREIRNFFITPYSD